MLLLKVDQERLDLYEKSLVAQTIAAFSAVSENTDKKTSKPQITSRYQASESSDIPDDTLSAEILEARTNRDVVRCQGHSSLLVHYNPQVRAVVYRFIRFIGLFNIISSSNTGIENQLTYKQGSK